MTRRVEKVLHKYGTEVINEMITRLSNYGKQASGDLIKSLRYDIIEVLDELIPVPDIKFSMIDYGVYVDKGRKPNSKLPPKGVLLEWMKLKGIPANKEFPIRASIAKFGIPPTNFWSISTTRTLKRLEKNLDAASAQDQEELMLGVVEELLQVKIGK